MLFALTLLAQEDGAVPKDGVNPFNTFMLPMILVMAAFFFLIVLPAQRKEKKQREQLLTNLKKNDEVITTSGIIGVVQTIRKEEDEVTLKVDDNTRLRVLLSSIARIRTPKEGPKT